MDINQMKSNLKMDNFYFKDYSFHRDTVIKNGEYKVDLKKDIRKLDDHVFEVEVVTSIEKDDMHMNLVANATFTFEADDYSSEDSVIDANTVAIMFPFIRSQVTLMTSQPGMTPIVLPPINTRKFK